jgi:hypothetical protein
MANDLMLEHMMAPIKKIDGQPLFPPRISPPMLFDAFDMPFSPLITTHQVLFRLDSEAA